MSKPSHEVAERRIEKIKRQSDLLVKLLADQHPGLVTWVSALCTCIEEMHAVIEGQRDE